MAHLLVEQLRFTRREFARCFAGVSADEGCIRVEQMNCLSWILGHLAEQEQRFWVVRAQGKDVVADLQSRVGPGQPASTPPLDEMWDAWHAIMAVADEYLETVTPAVLQTILPGEGGNPSPENVGTKLLKNIYHYWLHIGQAVLIRKLLGHPDLPQFVGEMSNAMYRPE
ncbi:DUF664 domain-containing protein [candidate division KSB3 bacterium]|uniref:DUF664 domain-containing protein n=1 Tax=candidate division KSB3 bacterium TaxID=2044937 RepID=A0A9D5Q8N4_9BACT|nr:DUF664 domain-containing protein [candidate division KSB3 bacterium]MBD3327046.1 DUF664 domain-containing protein [candidate division KSB3 bacterium]